MLLTILTIFHVIISLVGILAGFVFLIALLAGREFERWTTVFLVTTVVTSVTGFLFPFEKFLPSHATGILSLIVLGAAIYAKYSRRLSGR